MGHNPDIVLAVAGLAASLLSVAQVWLRLHFQLRRQQERRRYLLAAATLPTGSQLRDRHGDGAVLALTVGTPRQVEESR